MNRWIVVFLSVLVSGATAQPKPESGEPVDAYLHRYANWLESVPVQERAWKLLQAVDSNPNWGCSAAELTADPHDERWESSRSFVTERPEMIERILVYAGRASLGMPTESMTDPAAEIEKVPPTISLLSPHLGVLMKHARLMTIDALVGAGQGDHARVIRNFEAVIDLQQHAVITGSMIERLVQYAMLAPLYESILSDYLELESWSAHDLGLLAATLEDIVDEDGLSAAVRYERWHCLDVVNWLYADSKDGRLATRGADRLLHMTERLSAFDENSSGPLRDGQMRTRTSELLSTRVKPKAEQVELVGRIFDLMESAFSAAPHRLEQFESTDLVDSMSSDTRSGLTYAPVLISMPDLASLYKRGVYAQGRRSAAMSLLALHRHRVEHACSQSESMAALGLS